MSSSKFFTLKTARLNNNCPECYSNDELELTFKQKFIETNFYKAITHDISHEMYCHTCNTSIFPIQWTEDIERIVAYQERVARPKPKSLKLKPLAWIILLLGLVVFVAIILIATGPLSF